MKMFAVIALAATMWAVGFSGYLGDSAAYAYETTAYFDFEGDALGAFEYYECDQFYCGRAGYYTNENVSYKGDALLQLQGNLFTTTVDIQFPFADSLVTLSGTLDPSIIRGDYLSFNTSGNYTVRYNDGFYDGTERGYLSGGALVQLSVVPLPGTAALFGFGLLALGLIRRSNRRSARLPSSADA